MGCPFGEREIPGKRKALTRLNLPMVGNIHTNPGRRQTP